MTIIIVISLLYFVPTIVAVTRNIRSQLGVAVLNGLIGWTVIGWIIMLAWAVSGEKRPKTAAE